MGGLFCILSPGACAVKSIAKATLGDLFDALTNWVLSSVQWFLTAAGQVHTNASEPTTVIRSATQEFNTLPAPCGASTSALRPRPSSRLRRPGPSPRCC